MNEDYLADAKNQGGADKELRIGRRGASVFESIHTDHLRRLDYRLYDILSSDDDIDVVRAHFYDLLSKRELYYHSLVCSTESLERVNALCCIQVLRNLISPRNEIAAGCSTLLEVIRIVSSGDVAEEERALFLDFFHIVKGSMGLSGIYRDKAPQFRQVSGREAAIRRSDFLDGLAAKCQRKISAFPNGLDQEVVNRRNENRERIMRSLKASETDWHDYRWQLRNVRRSVEDLAGLIELTPDEEEAISLATDHHLPFGITPYYLSLMDYEAHRRNDHAVRAQVIPPLSYVKRVLSTRDEGSLDFMREDDTSPVPLVTRRYPMIAILKPYNSCAQICVYCQRNWEIKDVLSPSAQASRAKLDEALLWFEEHPLVSEILITGGDPLLLSDHHLFWLLTRLASMEHIRRIRIGTRLPVVLPMRFNNDLIKMLGVFNDPPRRELCLVTHFEHPYEVTPATAQCVNKVRRDGISIYNQQVFTTENSRRFETVALRLLMKQIGVDPYYTFNTKGKEETDWYRVPIARILQERKEEARMVPGLTRTDVPVFNIPALGKNNLGSWQNHDLIMITPRGERVYEFHPWEKNIASAPTYIYQDVPILDYLLKLKERSEDPQEYGSIWYYF
jgi:lysine 2,3-aminomutase